MATPKTPLDQDEPSEPIRVAFGKGGRPIADPRSHDPNGQDLQRLKIELIQAFAAPNDAYHALTAEEVIRRNGDASKGAS
jgi:hypothetical protein